MIEIAEHEAGQQHVEDMGEAACGFARALGAEFLEQQRRKTDDGIDQGEAAEDAAADREAGADADDQDVRGEGAGYSSRQPHQAQHQDDHRDSKWRVLRVHEHVAVEGRAQHQQQQRRQPCERAADAAAKPPRHAKPDQADNGAEQAAGLEQFKWNDLVQQCCGHIEAAAIHVEIGERQRRGVLEAGAVHPQQQIGIFGVGVVVPAQAIITKCQAAISATAPSTAMARSSQVRSTERRAGVSMAEVVMDDMAIGNPASLWPSIS